jgi:hypothetical protein
MKIKRRKKIKETKIDNRYGKRNVKPRKEERKEGTIKSESQREIY